MNAILTYFGHVKDKKLVIRDRRMFDADIALLDGKDVEITLRRKRSKRSDEQNGYYWGAVIPIMQQGFYDAGYKLTKEETHEYLKGKFTKDERVNEATGEILTLPGSTKKLSKSEFMEYIADIAQFAAEYLGVTLPQPGEQLKFE